MKIRESGRVCFIEPLEEKITYIVRRPKLWRNSRTMTNSSHTLTVSLTLVLREKEIWYGERKKVLAMTKRKVYINYADPDVLDY